MSSNLYSRTWLYLSKSFSNFLKSTSNCTIKFCILQSFSKSYRSSLPEVFLRKGVQENNHAEVWFQWSCFAALLKLHFDSIISEKSFNERLFHVETSKLSFYVNQLRVFIEEYLFPNRRLISFYISILPWIAGFYSIVIKSRLFGLHVFFAFFRK